MYVRGSLIIWEQRINKYWKHIPQFMNKFSISDIYKEIMLIITSSKFLGVKNRSSIFFNFDNMGEIFLSYNDGIKRSRNMYHVTLH